MRIKDDGGGGRGGSGRGDIIDNTTLTGTGNRTYQNGVEGNQVDPDSANHGWYFDLGSGKRVKGTWVGIAYSYDGKAKVYGYHPNADGVMDSDWRRND